MVTLMESHVKAVAAWSSQEDIRRLSNPENNVQLARLFAKYVDSSLIMIVLVSKNKVFKAKYSTLLASLNTSSMFHYAEVLVLLSG